MEQDRTKEKKPDKLAAPVPKEKMCIVYKSHFENKEAAVVFLASSQGESRGLVLPVASLRPSLLSHGTNALCRQIGIVPLNKEEWDDNSIFPPPVR